ncbi:Reticulocyte binding-like protein 2b [Aphelenchoides bicaudatus]|nr:Reticulocyte binding-like protein 2b [Aphelenchoides bicaudatus]
MDLLKCPEPHQENGTNSLDSCSSNASTSNACSSPVHLKNGTVDGSFKTPAVPPQKKANMPLKKRLTTPEAEGATRESEIGQLNSKIDALGLAKDSKADDSQSDSASESKAETSPTNPSTMCPNSKKCFADRYPRLATKSTTLPDEDLLEEIIVDEFSLILFNSIDDFKEFKIHNDQILKKERAEEEQKRLADAALAREEELIRLSKLKKKGRKSKAELEKAQRLLRKQERHKKREKLKRRKEKHRIKAEQGLLVPKDETPEQKELREQKIKERSERHQLLRDERQKKRFLKEKKKAQQKAALSSQSVSTTLQQSPVHPLGAAIGISEAQRQRLDQQLYHMRKPSTPKNMDDLFATAAAAFVFAANPAELLAQNARQVQSELVGRTGNSTPSTSLSAQLNENAGHSEAARPTSTASGKRPLSVLDQQLNGPNSKMMKLEEDHKKELLAMQAHQANSRRNSLQNQQIPQRLYSPFVGMQQLGIPAANTFAIPQIPLQRAQQQFDPLANLPMSAIPIASLLQPGLIPPSLNPMQLNQALNPAARANPAIPGTSIASAGPSSALNKQDHLSANPLNAFPNNPEFSVTLQHAINAMNAVDPSLLSLNQHLLGIGAQNSQSMPLNANSLMNQLNMAQKQLEQLGQHQAQRTPLGIQQPPFGQQPNASPIVHKQSIGSKPPFMQQQQPQIRTAQIPISNMPKPQMDTKKMPRQTPPRRSQNPSASNSQIPTPQLGAQNPGRSDDIMRTVSPTSASSIGIQYPLGTALASQLAGAQKLVALSTIETKGEHWNHVHIDIATTLQKLFTDNPELDDGSRESQPCPEFPREWRSAANSQALHLQSGNEQSTSNGNTTETPKEQKEGETSETSRTEPVESTEPSTSESTTAVAEGSENKPTTEESNNANPLEVGQSVASIVPAQATGQTSSQETVPATSQESTPATSQASVPATTQELPQTTTPSAIQTTAQTVLQETTPAAIQTTVQTSIPIAIPQNANPQLQTEQTRLASVPNVRAPIVVSQQQAQQQAQEQRLLQAQQLGIPVSTSASQLTEALLQQQLVQAALASQASQVSAAANQNRIQASTAGFPFAQQKAPGTSRTPVPTSSNAAQSSLNAAQLASAAALHPSLSALGGLGGSLTAGLPVNNMDSAKLMMMYQQKQKDEQQFRNMQAAVGREMAKKSNASNIRIKEEPKRQTPHQQMLPQQSLAGLNELAVAQSLANAFPQNLPTSTQYMLQQLIGAQNSQAQNQQLNQIQQASMLANLQAQLTQSAAAQQRPTQNAQAQLLAVQQAAQQQAAQAARQQQAVQQQLGLQSMAALNNAARPNQQQIDQNQMLALSLLQQQASLMDSQASRSLAQQIPQQQQQALDNAEILRQLQQSMMLERTLNPQQAQLQQIAAAQAQAQQAQQAQEQRLLQQLQNAVSAPNQNQVAGGNLLHADLLMRQMLGDQPANLQRNVQDRQQKTEQHRQFREQLIAAANAAPNQATSAAPGPMAPSLYQLAALQQNGQAASAAAQLASLQQQQALAAQLKNPASLMGTPQKN